MVGLKGIVIRLNLDRVTELAKGKATVCTVAFSFWGLPNVFLYPFDNGGANFWCQSMVDLTVLSRSAGFCLL